MSNGPVINSSLTPPTLYVNTCNTPPSDTAGYIPQDIISTIDNKDMCSNSSTMTSFTMPDKEHDPDDTPHPALPKTVSKPSALDVPHSSKADCDTHQRQGRSSTKPKRQCHYLSNGRGHSSEYNKCKACSIYICTSCLMSPYCHKDCFKGNKIDRRKIYK